MTTSERTRVLEMVAKGTISIEQADQLLEALESAKPTRTDPTEAQNADEEESWKRFGQDWARFGQDWGRWGRELGQSLSGGRNFPRPPRPPRAPKGVGGGKLSFEQMIELGKFGISAGYVRRLGEAGLSDLSFEEIIELGKFGIDADYVIELRKLANELGSGELTVDRIIELGKFGANPENVREMLSSGLFDLRNRSDRETTHDGRRRARLEAKLARVHARLEATGAERDRDRLRELAQALQDELETTSVEIEIEEEVEESDAQLQAGAPETEHGEP